MRMAAPWKDPRSGVWHLRQRTPSDLISFLKKAKVTLPAGDGHSATVTIGEVVKVSLRTRDDRVAKQRYAAANAVLHTFWERVRDTLNAYQLSQTVPRMPSFTLGPGGGMTWAEASSRFSSEAQTHLRALAPNATDANVAAVVAQTASTMDEVFKTLRGGDSNDAILMPPREITTPAPRIVSKRMPGFSTGAKKSQITISELWGRYVVYHSDKRAKNTLLRYGTSITKLADFVGGVDVRSITGDHIYAWAVHRRDVDNIHASTINSNDLVAASSLFAWAMRRQGESLLSVNPVKDISLDVPRKTAQREKNFRDAEVRAILRASKEVPVSGRDGMNQRAFRWCPWLAAYSGARISELTSLEVEDVREEQGTWIMFFDQTKTAQARSVPIHGHLIEQGFIEFVREVGSGALFYDVTKHASGTRTPPWEIRSRKVADWVRRTVGLDRAVDPNHGWRHTFKTRAVAVMPERIRDAIVGHAPATVSRRYEMPSIAMMAEGMRAFPRYDL